MENAMETGELGPGLRFRASSLGFQGLQAVACQAQGLGRYFRKHKCEPWY